MKGILMNIVSEIFKLESKKLYEIAKGIDFNFDQFSEQACQNGLDQIAKALLKLDDLLAVKLKETGNFIIVKKQSRTIYTTNGAVTFKRRYYYDKLNKTYIYPLDMIINLAKYKRVTDELAIKVLEKASDLTYTQVGQNLHSTFVLSKSTIYRIIKNTNVEKIESKSLIENSDKIHLQIDEKYVGIRGKKYKTRLYTATIFKRIIRKKNRSILQNVSYISAKSVAKLARKINKVLKERFKTTLETEIFLSGDYATYIQNFPDRITVCKTKYVPDRFHTFRAIKHLTGSLLTNADLNNIEILKQLAAVEVGDAYKYQCSQVINYIKKNLNKNPFSAYLDPTYLGCSQECTNSHIYASRFGKYGYKFNFKTIEKLALVREACKTGATIKISYIKKERIYEERDFTIGKEYMEIYKSVLDTSGMSSQTRKMFENIKYGVAQCF